MSTPRERTRDLYEELPGCARPPLISLPDPDDLESLERDLQGAKTHSLSFKTLRAVLNFLGFKKFQQSLTEDKLEGLLRRYDFRRINECAPALSATVNLADDPRGISPVERAATLLLAARQFYSEIRSGALVPDKHRGEVLEMGQYPNLFATSTIWEGRSRRPRIFKSTDTAHVIIAIGRQLYSLDLGELESGLSVGSLQEALRELVERAGNNPLHADEPSLGLLTCAKYETQRKAFRFLQKVGENRQTLQMLRHSVLTLCLDLDQMPESDGEAAHMAHSENLCNRWHHSSLQLVVFGNAKACAIFKFDACIDGNAMTRGAAEIQKRAARFPLQSQASPSVPVLPAATLLRCQIAPVHIRRAWKDVRSILDNQKATFEIRGVGRLFFKTCNVDPIPAFILALHLTFVHLTGKSARIAQMLTLSKYRCMGLTAAVVTTPEMKSFSQYMTGNEVRPDQAFALMLAAIDAQIEECRKARSHLPFSQLIPLFSYSLRGIRKIYGVVIVFTCWLIGIKWAAEVIVSHPSFFPEAPMLGRPGVRLPYVKYFGLHYRMLDDSIIVTMMPSLDWSIANAEVMSVLKKKLQDLKEMIGERKA